MPAIVGLEKLGMGREEIAERSNYSNTSSGFDKTLSQLSSIGVVTRPAPGMLDLADWVRELL